MGQRLSILDGLLQLSERPPGLPVVIETVTPVLDAVQALSSSGTQQLLVRTPDGRFAGIITQTDLMNFITQHSVDDQEMRLAQPIQNLMTARFLVPGQAHAGTRVSAGHHLPLHCHPIIEDDRLVAVMTDDDVLLSWRQIQPLVEAATTDPVTGLANRATFTRRLEEEWDRSRRTGDPLGFILIDLDWFKEVNDQCGHLAGDAVLAAVGSSLRRSLRSYDVVARYGGDEFAAICCNCHPDDINAPVLRLQDRIRQLIRPAGLQQRELTLSIGTAVVTGGFQDLNLDRVVKAADDCLYRAKAEGRNRGYRVAMNGSQLSEPDLIQPAALSGV